MQTLTTYRLSPEERREAADLLGGLTKVFEADPDLDTTTRERLETSLTWFWRNGSNPISGEKFAANLAALDLLIERLHAQADPSFWAAALRAVPHTPDAPETFGAGMAESRLRQAERLTAFRNRIANPAPTTDDE
ncbi:hypothetical protein DVS28_b0155 (plasmid) [Euzebya pacifica]|uniref:Uncharacterized protein n=1 Tax=Euzebya pacifica TaxID=1608957 RepID=A0A346Y628_9ACTN|nr:hypothetical protein [Euzebya pacifica]AXV09925.1 hypothetical protein DVS28_b0155 [Euzebya pacifica]